MNIKKILAGLMALAMTSIAVAQNGYSIEIKQVLPRNAVVYSNRTAITKFILLHLQPMKFVLYKTSIG